MKKLFVWCVLCSACAVAWAGSGHKVVYDVSSAVYNNDIVLDDEFTEETDSDSNRIVIHAGEFNGKLITGRSDSGNATKNELNIDGGTINSTSISAGVAQHLDATQNTMQVIDVTLPSTIVAGTAAAGTASENTIILKNATVNYNSLAPNQVIGGQTTAGSAEKNEVILRDGSTVKASVMGGYSSGTGNVSYNTVTIEGASKLEDGSGSGAAEVFGGYSKDGQSFNNQITLTDAAQVDVNLYGGYSQSNTATRNLITTQKATISGNMYGGYTSAGQEASYNEIRLGSQTTTSGIVAGGYAAGNGEVTSNKVSIAQGATLDSASIVYGGYAENGKVSANTVTVNANALGAETYGGYAANGTATYNTVTIKNATSGGTIVAGGWANAGEATHNTLSVSQSSLTGDAYGGYGATGASHNTASLTNSDLTGNLYGGYATSGAASNNGASASGSGKTISGSVYGGYSESAEASNNTVELSGVTVSGDVYGGYSAAGQATNNNTVRIGNGTTLSGQLVGGNGGTATGNTLVLQSFQGDVPTFSAFDRVELYGLDSQATFSQDVNAEVILYGRPDNVSTTLAYTNTNSTLSLRNTSLGAYHYDISSEASGSELAWSVKGGYENRLAKPYAQAQLAGLALAGMGDDLLGAAFREALEEKSPNNTFAGVQYYDNTYDTGSGFDLQSMVAQGGTWWKSGENVFGLFAQYAHGHYSTDPIDATGRLDTYGLGGFVLLPYSDQGRFEVIARGGYQTNDFRAGELSSDLKMKTFYAGASAGIVQEVSWLELYGKVNYLYLFADKVHDNLGQSINFEGAQSITGVAGLRWNLMTIAQKYKPYIGASGIYEMDGEGNVKVDGHKVKDADLGGLTGKGELGVIYDTQDSMIPMKSIISVFGLIGRTEGWGANLKLLFTF